MKKLIFLSVIFTILVSCSGKSSSASSPLDYIASVSSTDLQLETGGLVTLRMSESDILEKRGKPEFRGTMKNGEVALKYEDYQYSLIADRVVIYTIEPGQLTAKQVKIGDDEGQVVKAYGQHYYKRTDNKMNFMGYLDKENHKVIEFVMNQSKVEMILVADFSLYSK